MADACAEEDEAANEERPWGTTLGRILGNGDLLNKETITKGNVSVFQHVTESIPAMYLLFFLSRFFARKFSSPKYPISHQGVTELLLVPPFYPSDNKEE